MSHNTSVSLGDHFVSFIQQQVNDGRYGSTSDVIRAALRLLEERETKLHALQNMLIEGENSGDPIAVNTDNFLKLMQKKHAK